jgi:hypothetical protein
MPVMQKIPLQKHSDEEECEPKHSGGKHERKQVISLKLAAGIQDRITQSAFPNAAGTGKQLARDGAYNRNTRRDANAHEKIRQSVRQSQLEEYLQRSRIMHQEEMHKIFFHTDEALRGIGDNRRKADNESDQRYR